MLFCHGVSYIKLIFESTNILDYLQLNVAITFPIIKHLSLSPSHFYSSITYALPTDKHHKGGGELRLLRSILLQGPTTDRRRRQRPTDTPSNRLANIYLLLPVALRQRRLLLFIHNMHDGIGTKVFNIIACQRATTEDPRRRRQNAKGSLSTLLQCG